MTNNQFSSGLELGNFVVTSDPVHQAWSAIEKQKQINRNAEPSLYNEIQQSDDTNPTIIAFGTPLISLQGQEGLVSSSTLKENNFTHFEFLSNKSNPRFSINQAAIELFRSHYDALLHLKNKLIKSKSKPPPLVILTGHSVGGSVATLFTLWLLQGLNLSKTKRPLCITFGSPLVGDEHLRQCVLQFSSWKSCFLHVASNQDPTPNVFLSQNTIGAYKPFGTFLLCSASGCACYDDPDFILEQLVTFNSQSTHDNQDPNLGLHYGQILEDLKCKALCNVFKCTQEESDSLQASIITQLQAIGVVSQQQPVRAVINLIGRMKKHETKLLIQKKKISDSDKKLNEMKVFMAFLEWFKKESKQRHIVYYNLYRNQWNPSDINVNEIKKKLMQYWEECVAEVENMPQIEGAHFRFRWLWAGTAYRRMIEPLHIADYYRDGGKNYITAARPRHFILLEQWSKEGKIFEASRSRAIAKRQIAKTRLGDDSCFWAYVEEALISCDVLEHEGSSIQEKESSKKKLKDFEVYVYDTLKNYAVSPDIYLENGSFMYWWRRYEAIMGRSYCCTLMLEFWEAVEACNSPNS